MSNVNNVNTAAVGNVVLLSNFTELRNSVRSIDNFEGIELHRISSAHIQPISIRSQL